MKKSTCDGVRLALLCAAAGLSAPASAASADVEKILRAYAADYESDPTFVRPATFGVRVGGEWWTVEATPGEGGARGTVTVAAGAPAKPALFYTVESEEVLARVERGEMNALTAMVKAYGSDATPMDFDVMEGFHPGPDFLDVALPLTFHFWTRGIPEIVPFGGDLTRVAHGANVGVFYYQPGLRSGWFHIRPGQHVNEPADQQTNPFPTMMIMLEGEATARIGGRELQFTKGNMVFIPAGVEHELWNDGKEPALGFLFMFGEGA